MTSHLRVFLKFLSVCALVSITGAMLAACGPAQAEFQNADPVGYESCAHYSRSIGAGGNYRRDAEHAAAETGLSAETEAIRNAIDDRNNGTEGAPMIRDAKQFIRACKKSGFSF